MRTSLSINTTPSATTITLSEIGHVERYVKRQEEVIKAQFEGFYNKSYHSHYRNVYIITFSIVNDITAIQTLFDYVRDHYTITLTDGTNEEVVMLQTLPWQYIKDKTDYSRIELIFTGVTLTDTLEIV